MNITEPTFHAFTDEQTETQTLWFTPDGSHLWVRQLGNRVHQRNITTRQVAPNPLTPHDRTNFVVVSPCGNRLLCVVNGHTINIYDGRERNLVPTTFRTSRRPWIQKITISEDGTHLAFASSGHSEIWNISNGPRRISKISRFNGSVVKWIQFSKDNKILYLFTSALYEIDVATGNNKKVSKRFPGTSGSGRFVTMSRHGSYLAAGNETGNIYLLDTETMEKSLLVDRINGRHFKRAARITAVIFSPCEDYLVVASKETDPFNSRIKIFCRKTGKVQRALSQLSQGVSQMAVSRNARYLAMNARRVSIPAKKSDIPCYSLIDFKRENFGLYGPTTLEQMFVC